MARPSVNDVVLGVVHVLWECPVHKDGRDAFMDKL